MEVLSSFTFRNILQKPSTIIGISRHLFYPPLSFRALRLVSSSIISTFLTTFFRTSAFTIRLTPAVSLKSPKRSYPPLPYLVAKGLITYDKLLQSTPIAIRPKLVLYQNVVTRKHYSLNLLTPRIPIGRRVYNHLPPSINPRKTQHPSTKTPHHETGRTRSRFSRGRQGADEEARR